MSFEMATFVNAGIFVSENTKISMRWKLLTLRDANVKSKGKFVPTQATKRCSGSGDIVPHIHNLGTKWKRVGSVTPRQLYSQGKFPRCPFRRRNGRPQSQYGRFGKAEHSLQRSEFEARIIQPTV